jgi:hypothetical protein
MKAIFVSAKKYIICIYMKSLQYIKEYVKVSNIGGGGVNLNCPSIQLEVHSLEYGSKLDCFINLSIGYSETFMLLFWSNLESVKRVT